MKTFIFYTSIEGNTKAFLQKLKKHDKDNVFELVEVDDMTDLINEDDMKDYFVFVPTYLDGGNGIDNGVKEVMTNALGEYIEDLDNGEHCLGIVGSGNRNFNQQFCLTARRYSKKFNVPFLDEYELRGNESDAERIYNILLDAIKANEYIKTIE